MIYQKESLPNFVDSQLTDDMIFSDFMNVMEESIVTTDLAFTPTTLRKFQNTFSELNNDLALSAAADQCSSSGQHLMSPNQSDDSDFDDDSSQASSSNSNMVNDRKRKIVPEYITMARVTAGSSSTDQRPPRKLPGPRPKRTLEEMTPIEAERRKRRRERNKNAASKCRQRRLEQTNELLNETDELEQEAMKLEREIASLRRQKAQLEYVLDSHKSTCKAVPFLTAQPQLDIARSIKLESKPAVPSQPTTSQVFRPNSLPISQPMTTSQSNISNVLTTMDSFSMFTFDPITSMSGLTPMLSSVADMNSPSAFVLLSPSTLLFQ